MLARRHLSWWVHLFWMTIFWTSCTAPRPEPEPEKLFALFEMFYFEAKDSTLVLAGFQDENAQGETKELTGIADIAFNGQSMSFDNDDGIYTELLPGFVSTGLFDYRNELGATSMHALELIPIDFPARFDTIPISTDYAFSWTGDFVGPGEQVILVMSNPANGASKSFSQIVEGFGTIDITRQELDSLGTGPVNALLFRFFVGEEELAGGNKCEIIGIYETSPKEVYLSPN